jgi:uncharacterized phiE125 gp8 family phage protein
MSETIFTDGVASASVTAPVTVAQFKTFARIDINPEDTAEDSLIESFILAANRWVEDRISRTLITQVHRMTLDRFPDIGSIVLYRSPVVSVASLTYWDTAGTQQTMDPADYRVVKNTDPARIEPIEMWPAIQDRLEAVEVNYTAGYGTSADQVPEGLKTAVLYRTYALYERVAEYAEQYTRVAESLLSPFWSGHIS